MANRITNSGLLSKLVLKACFVTSGVEYVRMSASIAIACTVARPIDSMLPSQVFLEMRMARAMSMVTNATRPMA